jgi:hypothetical protein
MPIHIPTDPETFFTEFVPEEFTKNTEGRALPHMPYSLSIELTGASKYYYKVNDGKLEMKEDVDGDFRVTLSEEDFKELVRAARSNAPDSPPPPPKVPPTYQFPALDALQGSFRVVIDDLGDKRTIDIAIGSVPSDAKPKTVVHTTIDFIAAQQGKDLAGVEAILRSGGVKIEGDLGYLLRIANAFTGKTRRRER